MVQQQIIWWCPKMRRCTCRRGLSTEVCRASLCSSVRWVGFCQEDSDPLLLQKFWSPKPLCYGARCSYFSSSSMYMYVCTSMMVAGSAAADVASMVVLPPPAANPGVAMASSGFEHLPNSKSCTICVCLSNIHREPTCGSPPPPACASSYSIRKALAPSSSKEEQPFDKSTHVRRNSDHNPLLARRSLTAKVDSTRPWPRVASKKKKKHFYSQNHFCCCCSWQSIVH